jgi:hypothetical protein
MCVVNLEQNKGVRRASGASIISLKRTRAAHHASDAHKLVAKHLRFFQSSSFARVLILLLHLFELLLLKQQMILIVRLLIDTRATVAAKQTRPTLRSPNLFRASSRQVQKKTKPDSLQTQKIRHSFFFFF